MNRTKRHASSNGGQFFQRTEFHLPGLPTARDELERTFATEVAERFGMEFRLTEAAKPKRVAIMVSKSDHCVLDLLWRNRRGELDMSAVMVISNHPDLADEIAHSASPTSTSRRPGTTAPKPSSASWNCYVATSTWSCWPATCRSSALPSWPRWAAR
jgi:formyltetrahydrofolate hydrolase